MSLNAPNISVATFDGIATIERSPLPYNDRRRFGNRLKRLYAHLRTIKADQYDHDSLVGQYAPKAPACGSIACAFGHAVISDKFKGLHATVTLKRGSKPDEHGLFSDDDLNYKVINKPALKAMLKAKGLRINEGDDIGDFSTAADAYFGPCAWRAIFDIDAYPWSGKGVATKATVMRRIKMVAQKAYGINVSA